MRPANPRRPFKIPERLQILRTHSLCPRAQRTRPPSAHVIAPPPPSPPCPPSRGVMWLRGIMCTRGTLRQHNRRCTHRQTPTKAPFAPDVRRARRHCEVAVRTPCLHLQNVAAVVCGAQWTGLWGQAFARTVLQNPNFFLLRTALKDSPQGTTNREPPPTANRQPPTVVQYCLLWFCVWPVS